MRCHKVERALLEKELALLSSRAEAALVEHLAGCGECAARARAEARLTADLAALRVEPDLAIDVTERVVSGLGEVRPERVDVSTGQLGWAAAAALGSGMAILAGLWQLLPELQRVAGDGWTLASALGQAATRTALASGTVLAAAVKALGRVAESLAPLVALLEGLQPIALAAVTASALIMASTIVLVVGRDLRGSSYSRGTPR